MKLDTFEEIVFVNPSVNLNKIASYVENYGYNIKRVKTNINFKTIGNRLVYKDNESYTVFRFDMLSTIPPDIFYRYSDNFLNRLLYKNFLKKNNITSALDYLIKNRFPLSEPALIYYKEELDNLRYLNNKKLYLTSYLTDRDIPDLKFNKIIHVYKLADNLQKFIGTDYAIVKYENSTIEFFINEENLFLISEKGKYLEHIITKTFLKNVKMELVDKIKLFTNNSPMIKKIKNNLYLINDFSFFNISINLGKKWFESIGGYICTGKL
ncbi:MAG: hypothetical protein N3C60_04355 [Calditerrivibrio sp.]|nr:hypothetical protein [Calditerrivibrio sp.]